MVLVIAESGNPGSLGVIAYGILHIYLSWVERAVSSTGMCVPASKLLLMQY